MQEEMIVYMGIPYYFASLIRQHKDIVSRVHGCQTPDILAIDFNCLIHSYIDDSDPINSVIAALRNILTNVCKATKFTYVAMDGLVPYGKMVQQRYRRFRKQETVPEFDRHQISPETGYMKELAVAVRSAFPDLVVSDTSEHGEGEHKLLNWLKTLPENKRRSVCVYGLDADLILLCLSQRKLSMPYSFFLLRENRGFNKDDEGFSTLSVWRLADKVEIPIEQYLALSILCFGNDFMPNLGMFSLREGGHERALTIYKSLGNPDLSTTVGIMQFVSAARENELPFYLEKVKTRNKKAERAIISEDGKFYVERYITHILDGANPNDVANAYLKTLAWTLEYFFTNNVPDWEWYYPYPDAPLLEMFFNREAIDSIEFNKNITYSTIHQLQFILPSSSVRKNKKRVAYHDEFYDEETEMRIGWMKRYNWECRPRISLPWHPSEKETRIEVWKMDP
jgi:5'-3' exonuclease